MRSIVKQPNGYPQVVNPRRPRNESAPVGSKENKENEFYDPNPQTNIISGKPRQLMHLSESILGKTMVTKGNTPRFGTLRNGEMKKQSSFKSGVTTNGSSTEKLEAEPVPENITTELESVLKPQSNRNSTPSSPHTTSKGDTQSCSDNSPKRRTPGVKHPLVNRKSPIFAKFGMDNSQDNSSDSGNVSNLDSTKFLSKPNTSSSQRNEITVHDYQQDGQTAPLTNIVNRSDLFSIINKTRIKRHSLFELNERPKADGNVTLPHMNNQSMSQAAGKENRCNESDSCVNGGDQARMSFGDMKNTNVRSNRVSIKPNKRSNSQLPSDFAVRLALANRKGESFENQGNAVRTLNFQGERRSEGNQNPQTFRPDDQNNVEDLQLNQNALVMFDFGSAEFDKKENATRKAQDLYGKPALNSLQILDISAITHANANANEKSVLNTTKDDEMILDCLNASNTHPLNPLLNERDLGNTQQVPSLQETLQRGRYQPEPQSVRNKTQQNQRFIWQREPAPHILEFNDLISIEDQSLIVQQQATVQNGDKQSFFIDSGVIESFDKQPITIVTSPPNIHNQTIRIITPLKTPSGSQTGWVIERPGHASSKEKITNHAKGLNQILAQNLHKHSSSDGGPLDDLEQSLPLPGGRMRAPKSEKNTKTKHFYFVSSPVRYKSNQRKCQSRQSQNEDRSARIQQLYLPPKPFTSQNNCFRKERFGHNGRATSSKMSLRASKPLMMVVNVQNNEFNTSCTQNDITNAKDGSLINRSIETEMNMSKMQGLTGLTSPPYGKVVRGVDVNEVFNLKEKVKMLTDQDKENKRTIERMRVQLETQNKQWSNKMEVMMKKWRNLMNQQRDYYENLLKQEKENNHILAKYQNSCIDGEHQLMTETQSFISEMTTLKSAAVADQRVPFRKNRAAL